MQARGPEQKVEILGLHRLIEWPLNDCTLDTLLLTLFDSIV